MFYLNKSLWTQFVHFTSYNAESMSVPHKAEKERFFKEYAFCSHLIHFIFM